MPKVEVQRPAWWEVLTHQKPCKLLTLTQKERDTLRRAMEICDAAGELQAKLLQEEDLSPGENDFEWARIYLAHCLEEG